MPKPSDHKPEQPEVDTESLDADLPVAGTPPENMDESKYQNANSGRRASGHGGGSLDRPTEFEGERHEAGYAFSGGGRGHTPVRSHQQEAKEELESRSGPYDRSGRPAAEDSKE